MMTGNRVRQKSSKSFYILIEPIGTCIGMWRAVAIAGQIFLEGFTCFPGVVNLADDSADFA